MPFACITVYSFQSVSCCIIVGLMIFVSSFTVHAFPRSYFVCLWSAMRYVQKNLFFSPATSLTDEGLMTRKLCTVVQVSRPCHHYRNYV